MATFTFNTAGYPQVIGLRVGKHSLPEDSGKRVPPQAFVPGMSDLGSGSR